MQRNRRCGPGTWGSKEFRTNVRKYLVKHPCLILGFKRSRVYCGFLEWAKIFQERGGLKFFNHKNWLWGLIDAKTCGSVQLKEWISSGNWGLGKVLSQSVGLGQHVPEPGWWQKEESWVCFPWSHPLPTLCSVLSHFVSQVLCQLASG